MSYNFPAVQLTPHYPQYLQEKSSTNQLSLKSTSVVSDGSRPSHRRVRQKTSVHPAYNPSISLTLPVVQQVAVHNKRQLGLEPPSLSTDGDKDQVDYSYFRAGQESHRRGSYESAVQLGSVEGEGVSPTSQEDETRCVSYYMLIL